MKIIYFAAFTLLLASCKKNTTTDPIVDGITDNNVSGKLKRIIESTIGTRTAYIYTFDYDASNRLTKLKEWSEDSTFNPIKISGEKSSTLIYSGASDFPTKSITTRATGIIDSTLYYYDAQNRVIKEDWYRNNANTFRSLCSYGSNNLIVIKSYIGSLLQLSATDSIVRDNVNKIIETRSYNAANIYTGKSVSTYDTKINPLSYLNAFKYIYALNGDDRRGEFYRAPNNVTLFKAMDASSSIFYSQNANYNYSTNSFPISASASTVRTSTSTVTQNYIIAYEYY
jgi:hypothetical protein